LLAILSVWINNYFTEVKELFRSFRIAVTNRQTNTAANTDASKNMRTHDRPRTLDPCYKARMHKEGTPYHADPAEHRVQAGVGVVLVIAEKTLQVCVKALARH